MVHAQTSKSQLRHQTTMIADKCYTAGQPGINVKVECVGFRPVILPMCSTAPALAVRPKPMQKPTLKTTKYKARPCFQVGDHALIITAKKAIAVSGYQSVKRHFDPLRQPMQQTQHQPRPTQLDHRGGKGIKVAVNAPFTIMRLVSKLSLGRPSA